jgi:hypothetical protein
VSADFVEFREKAQNENKGQSVAEPSGQPRARLWDQPAMAWRIAALVLAVIPQVTHRALPYPSEFPS